jgi:hypothetical protein
MLAEVSENSSKSDLITHVESRQKRDSFGLPSNSFPAPITFCMKLPYTPCPVI